MPNHSFGTPLQAARTPLAVRRRTRRIGAAPMGEDNAA